MHASAKIQLHDMPMPFIQHKANESFTQETSISQELRCFLANPKKFFLIPLAININNAEPPFMLFVTVRGLFLNDTE